MTQTPKDCSDGVRVWKVTWEGTPGLAWAAMHLSLRDEPRFGEEEMAKQRDGFHWGKASCLVQQMRAVPGGRWATSHREDVGFGCKHSGQRPSHGDGCCSVACAVRCGGYVSKCVNKGETIGEIDLDFGKALSPVHQQFDVQGRWQPGKYKLLK